jgi:hypothetical protein
MANAVLPKQAEHAILDALRRVGYEDSLIDHNVEFNIVGVTSPYLEPVPVVAFWDQPFDQLTSAISVRCLPSTEYADHHVGMLGRYLWTPYSIVARPDYCELWEALPTNGVRQPLMLEDSVPYSELASKLEVRRDDFSPDKVRDRKLRWRQMSLYEVVKKPTAFFEWAFCPTRDELKRMLKRALLEGLHDHLDMPAKAERLRWLLRFTGVRIAWDKGWLPCSSRNSATELVSVASKYPIPLQVVPEAYELAERFIDSVGSSISLGIADGGLLSQILQTNGLVEDLRREWKLYPTPPDIAWEMVETIPIEAVAEADRLVWDGTCGTGTLMVVSMERLRQLSNRYDKEPEEMTRSLIGNDRQPLLADLSRLALDTALGKLQGASWQIQTSDVLKFGLDSFERRPNIIVGNPPFEARGPRADLAMRVIERYIDVLEPGGVLTVVLPRTILGATGGHAVKFREKLLKGFELYEMWELPQGFAPNVSSEAAIVCGRKRYSHEIQRSAVVWKVFEPSRRNPPLTDVVSSPDIWLKSDTKALESPLMLRLRRHLKGFPRLSDIIGPERITMGITLGAEGSQTLLQEEEFDSRPYLTGRTDMTPFYIPWRENPRWIRYSDSTIHRARRRYKTLFQGRKVLVSRKSTGGSPWSTRSAVDELGLYPSDDFIVVAPEPSLSCEVVAALFNSALICLWIRLANPARTIRVGECASIPIPETWTKEEQQRIEQITVSLSLMRHDLADRHQQGDIDTALKTIEAKTLELDELVYNGYQVPEEMRAQVSAYLIRRGKARPGFNRPLVREHEIRIAKAAAVFTEDHSRRMGTLLEARKQRHLSAEEIAELEDLLALWEKAQILSGAAALSQEQADWSKSLVSPA